ncbi:MAG: glycosyl hydrolase 53 family protein, partial [Firmicutes bacterium]|nr:glycosyl hydrolase 53 family protein [Bacillota bacterium]
MHSRGKRAMALVTAAALLLGLLAGCGAQKIDKVTGSSFLYVRKVENLPEDFIMGMDVSSVLAEEASGVKYYGYDGKEQEIKEQDIFLTLAQSGINYIRVRVWNDPFDADGHGFGGGNCTVDTAVEIGKRATKYGLKLLVDFHYS